MTKREKQIVRESFASLGSVAEPLALLFYGRLFEREPGLRPMFRGDIEAQGRKLMEMLTAVVENLDRAESLAPVLRAMGQRHAGYGVTDRHYDLVEQALLWALGQTLEADFDRETKAAWQAVIGQVSTVMKQGAALAASRPVGA
jgi:hemoglobin-like flavoprotein